jgi:GrpB-like predicted nucleotidyltransferase (UPF0157 family)
MPAGADPPIGCYTRVPVEVHEANPRAAEVAERLIALIAASWPGPAAEHVGSSAVPGLSGKGIIDLLLPTNPVDIDRSPRPCSVLASSARTPRPSRPPDRCSGASCTTGRPTIGARPRGAELEPRRGRQRGLRDALRADPALRHRYVALKRAIVEDGPVDPVSFTKAKHDWIAAALRRLGLPGGHHLYEGDPAGQVPPKDC